MDSSSDLKYAYAWPSTVNVANFVTVKPGLEGDERSNFKNWREQMVCLMEGQDVVGFVNGEILPPEKDNERSEQWYKLWRRTDKLVKGWILGSVGIDVLDAVRKKPTARDVWLKLDSIFDYDDEEEEEEDSDDDEDSGDFTKYLPLYQAAQRGDWDTAKNFFHDDINKISTTIISSDSETALHVAVFTGKANDFVNKLVELMPLDALALKDSDGETALHNAAIAGNTAAASALVKKNPDLLHIKNDSNRLAVLQAAVNCQRETLVYLISEHEANAEHNPLFEDQMGVELLNTIIACEFVDIALDLVHKYPNLAVLSDVDDYSALATIAGIDTLFLSTEAFSWWQKYIYRRIPIKVSKSEADAHTTSVALDIEDLSSDGAAHKNYSTSFQIISGVGQKVESMVWNAIYHFVPKVNELREKKARHQQTLQLVEYLCDKLVSLPENEASTIFPAAIEEAASYGISEIVEMIILKYPSVAFHEDSNGKNVFLLAATYRFENVINLLYNMSDRKYNFFDCIDNQDNNLMHLCGKLAPPDRLNLVAGAALQMQRELQWFKEMQNFVHTSRRTWTNKEKQTPQMLFTKEHAQLKADGERWMKDTANACTIAAALIATVMFAAAFTVPGGVESATGVPIFTGRGAFEIFAVSDAISLFTSITSLLLFLSILTSRYAEEDFLYVLPKRLSMGLLSLFVSITFMLVAFSATLYLLLYSDITWFVVLVVTFTCLPLTSFVLLQFPLLVDVIYSTYGPGIFGKKGHRILY